MTSSKPAFENNTAINYRELCMLTDCPIPYNDSFYIKQFVWNSKREYSNPACVMSRNKAQAASFAI